MNMCCIYASVNFPSLLRSEVGMGECCIYAHENGCSTYLYSKVALRRGEGEFRDYGVMMQVVSTKYSSSISGK